MGKTPKTWAGDKGTTKSKNAPNASGGASGPANIDGGTINNVFITNSDINSSYIHNSVLENNVINNNTGSGNIWNNTTLTGNTTVTGTIDFSGATVTGLPPVSKFTGKNIGAANAGAAISINDPVGFYKGIIQPVNSAVHQVASGASGAPITGRAGTAFFALAGTVIRSAACKVSGVISGAGNTTNYSGIWDIYAGTGTLGTNATKTGSSLHTGTLVSGSTNNNLVYDVIDNTFNYTIPSDGIYVLECTAVWNQLAGGFTSTLSFQCSASAGDAPPNTNVVYNAVGGTTDPMYVKISTSVATSGNLFPINGLSTDYTFVGIATAAASIGNPVSYQYSGTKTISGIVSGTPYYVNNSGVISATIGTVGIFVGYGSATNTISMTLPLYYKIPITNSIENIATIDGICYASMYGTGAGSGGNVVGILKNSVLGAGNANSSISVFGLTSPASCNVDISKGDILQVSAVSGFTPHYLGYLM